MPPARPPEFEPLFGTRATEPPLSDRLRDRNRGDDPATPIDEAATATSSPADDAEEIDPVAAVGDERGADAIEEQSIVPRLPAAASQQEDSDAPAAGEPATSSGSAASPGAVDTARVPSVDPGADGSVPVARSGAGTRWFRIRKRIVAGCAILIVVAVGYYLVSLFQVWTTGRADADGPVDAIVVMGAAQYDGRPSPQLEARLDHVLVRWEEGTAPLVVATGGNIPGDRFTEAQSSATYLIEHGVPEDAILLENAGSNTYESLEAVASLLASRGLDEVIIVTDPYHALRSRLIADEVGLDASVSSTDTSVVTGGESLRRHLQEAGGVAVGRVIGFERLTSLVD